MYSENDEEREQTLFGNPTSEIAEQDPDPSGYYAALGVSQSASQSAVRKAFLRLSQSYHTDKHSGSSEEVHLLMNDRFQKLQEAYAVLSDEKQRVAYNASGKKGIDRLALVPQSVNRPDDIVRYLATLEREAELLKMAKMLSAASTMELTYSIAHLFVPRSRLQQCMQHRQEQEHHHHHHTHTNDVVDSINESHDHGAQEESETLEENSGYIGNNESDPQTLTTEGSNDKDRAQPNIINAQMSVQEVIINGKSQIVLIPSDDMQSTLRQRMGVMTETKNNSASDRKGCAASPLTFGRYVMLAAVPKSLLFRYSFQHQLSPTLNLSVLADANQEGTRSKLGCTGHIEYRPDGINAHAVSCRASVGGLRINYIRTRVLNSLWSLRAKLTCLNGFTFLQKYEVALTRKLSKVWELENALVMSLSEHGIFKSTVSRALTSGVQQGISTHLGHHMMTFSLFDVRPVVYGGDNTKVVDTSASPSGGLGGARGYFRQTLVMMPFTGKTELAFQAWYHVSKWYSVGIGFGTVLPYSLSPVMPVTFIVRSPESACINQISLLYARGNHNIRIPIVAFISTRVQHALLWLAAPVALYRVAQHLWRPYARVRIAALCRQQRLEHQAEMDIARVRAMHEQHAIESASLRNRAMEERVGGLVILNAKYGVLQPRYAHGWRGNSQTATANATGGINRYFFSILSWWRRWRRRDASASLLNGTTNTNTNTNTGTSAASNIDGGDGAGGDAGLVMDVTVPLQNFVQDSRLILPEGSKSRLVGFTDPDPFTPEQKQLKIVYWFQKRRHMVIVNENDPVELPLREHLVDTWVS